MHWGKRFMDMDAAELKTAYDHHRTMFQNATTLAATAGAAFPQTFVRNSKIADFNFSRMRLVENCARKKQISLA